MCVLSYILMWHWCNSRSVAANSLHRRLTIQCTCNLTQPSSSKNLHKCEFCLHQYIRNIPQILCHPVLFQYSNHVNHLVSLGRMAWFDLHAHRARGHSISQPPVHPCFAWAIELITHLKITLILSFSWKLHQKRHFAHPKILFAHPELPFLAKSMLVVLKIYVPC